MWKEVLTKEAYQCMKKLYKEPTLRLTMLTARAAHRKGGHRVLGRIATFCLQ